MKFLLDANMPRSTLGVIKAHGFQAEHVKDIGMGDAVDEDIAAYAHREHAVLTTRDLDFADIRSYPPGPSPGYLVLRVPDNWIASRIATLMEDFLAMDDLVLQIPGHLVILDPHQVRFRPALDQVK